MRPASRTFPRAAGVTLMELLIAVTLLSLLSLGMVIAMQVGLSAFSKTNARLMDNRRVAGAQRIVEEEIQGLLPVLTPCGPGPAGPGNVFAFFQGEAAAMRLVSTFSLNQGWRGQPQLLEFLVIPGEGGRGVRLVVTEVPYLGIDSVSRLCTGRTTDPITGFARPVLVPVTLGEHPFVLADQLAYCRFSYLSPDTRPNEPSQPDRPGVWRSEWAAANWPFGVRIEMAPLDPNPAQIQPITITAPVRLLRTVDSTYVDN